MLDLILSLLDPERKRNCRVNMKSSAFIALKSLNLSWPTHLYFRYVLILWMALLEPRALAYLSQRKSLPQAFSRLDTQRSSIYFAVKKDFGAKETRKLSVSDDEERFCFGNEEGTGE
jgi:hypothetical protein